MSIFTKWRRKSGNQDGAVRLGRYTDAYKSLEQLSSWEEARAAFENNDPASAVLSLVQYLRDEREQNLVLEQGEPLIFSFFQGSKKIKVHLDDNRLFAESRIARVEGNDNSWMPRLLEDNYHFEFCKYAMRGRGELLLMFESHLADLTEYKFYYALRELALVADKMDDLLIGQSAALHRNTDSHIVPHEEGIFNAKKRFFRLHLDHLLSDLREVNESHGLHYRILDTVYAMDYYLQPQGEVMEAFERIHNLYFSMSLPDHSSKNRAAREILEGLSGMRDEKLKEEFYEVKHTFGILKPVDHITIRTLIDGERRNLSWYREQGNQDIIKAICGYIIGFCVFSYAPPQPLRDLFDMYFRYREPEFLSSLSGAQEGPHGGGEPVDKEKLKEELIKLQNSYQGRYPGLRTDPDQIDDISGAGFDCSLIEMAYDMDLDPVSDQ
ncbi:MAG: hypothetical protein R3275_09100 [Saprospiraceae bacterium]|nr:hypothetical protein [Saprospiraceae bacterium]